MILEVKMKIIGIVMLAILLTMPFAMAEDAVVDTAEDAELAEEDLELEGDPGITPDSPLYGLERAMERIGLALTFNKARKAEKGLIHAKERLLEARKMAEEGNIEAFEEAQAEHDEIMEEVEENVEELEEDTDEDTAEDTAEKVVGLQRAILAHQHRLETLRRVVENAPEAARANLERVLAKMENKTTEFEQKVEMKRERVKTKLRAIKNMTEEEIEEELEELEEGKGLDKLKERIREDEEEQEEEEPEEAEEAE
jgi:hypothetical protein